MPTAWSTSEPDGTETGVQLLAMAAHAGADLLVMDIERRGRLLDDVIAHARMTLLMQRPDA